MKRSRGFSFAEVMFAVVILGVGFIMVASVFPVAAEQTRTTNDQAIAAQLARDAFNIIQSSTTSEDFPAVTANSTVAFEDNVSLWNKISPSFICQTDHRYAWVPFYSRTSMDSPVCVTVLIVRRWVHDSYSALDQLSTDSELIPRNITVLSLNRQGDGSYLIEINRNTGIDDQKSQDGSCQSVAPGAYLIVHGGTLGGRALQVGSYQGDSDAGQLWKLLPNAGLDGNDSYTVGTASVIGRDFIDPTNQKLGYDGPAQDVSVFATYISPK